MAITISDNFDYKGKLPDFDRQEYATIADMKAVKKAKMPEMYIAYCLEDHKVYLYNKNNENDDTLGYWREFGAGGSSESIQVTALPIADESQVGKVYQYIGNSTLTEITGYFYIGIVASEDTQTVDITTLSDLKTTINESEISMEVNTGETTEPLNTYVFDGKYYYVVNDVVYVTTNTSGDVSVDTPIETDEAVVAQNLTKEVTVYTYGWQQINVQPTSGSSESIQVSVMPEANSTNKNKVVQYIGSDDSVYTPNYFYQCQETGQSIDPISGDILLTYDWVRVDVQPSGGSGGASDADDVDYDNTTSGLSATNVQDAIDEVYQDLNDLDIPDAIQVSSIPTASSELFGKIIQYTDEDTKEFVNGYFYQCNSSETSDSVEITSLEILEDAIDASDVTMPVTDNGETTDEKYYGSMYGCFYKINGTIYLNGIAEGDPIGDTSIDSVVTSADMANYTDMYYDDVTVEYFWSQKDVQPSGSSGASDASDVSYSNQDYPLLDNVEKALNNILGKIYYVEPKVNSFTMTPSTTEYEIGASVSNLVFNWTTNKEITVQTLTDCALADATVRTATAAGPYTSNKTFTLSIGDGENTATSSKSISFKHKVYWGSAADGTINSAFILALSNKKFATNYRGTYNMTVAQDEYGYLAYPSSWGTVTSWWIGGFEVSVYDCGEVSFTNASGNTTTFRVIRTTQPSLGAISPEIK